MTPGGMVTSGLPGDELLLSPFGILRNARTFVDAGKALQGRQVVVYEHYPVVPYLLGHGIELGLKAFLCAQGWSDQMLRGLGHDLSGCLAAANDAGLGSHIVISEPQTEAIASLNELYEKKELEYSKPLPAGGRIVGVPVPTVLIPLADDLVGALRGHCLEATQRLRQSG